jgi:hypothetical protein
MEFYSAAIKMFMSGWNTLYLITSFEGVGVRTIRIHHESEKGHETAQLGRNDKTFDGNITLAFISVHERMGIEYSKAILLCNSIRIFFTNSIFPHHVSTLCLGQKLYVQFDQATITSTDEFLSQSRKLISKMIKPLEDR